MDNFKRLQELLVTAEKEAFDFYKKGNPTAGTRLGLALQQVKSSAITIRQEVKEQKRKK